MIINFWQQLKKPFFCLAPMEEVTDFAFREMFASKSGGKSSVSLQARSASDGRGNLLTEDKIASEKDKALFSRNDTYNNFVMFTEFVNIDGLLHPEGRKKLEIDLKYSESQRPMVAQLWGRDPEKFKQAAELVAELKFDGVDINMGCPQSKEIASGACAALIREPKLAQEIIAAVKEGAGPMAVSVKTRIGYSRPEEMDDWVRNVLAMDIAALTLHGRTKKEMSKVPAHWDKIAEAVKIRDEMQGLRDKDGRTVMIGNGDVKTYQEGLELVKQTGCDGVMIGRGAFGYPWIFRADNYQPSVKERLDTMLEHAELFEQTFAGKKSFFIMRKHFKAYASGFPGSHELRAKLMEAKNLSETKKIVEEYLSK